MLTVIMATHNGAETLSNVMDAYCRLSPPRGGHKFVVVDNDSKDGSAEIIRRYSERLPLTLVHEPRRGKNVAVNTGLLEAEGDLYVFTDDDTVPAIGWLTAIRQAADEHPEYAIFAGRIDPHWPRDPGEAILEAIPLGPAYGVTERHLREGPTEPEMVFGGNMAVRRSVFDAGHGFDESLGPRAHNYIMGGETEFSVRLCALGFRAWFVEQALVDHIVRGGQLEPEWLERRAFVYGRSVCRKDALTMPADMTRFCGIPRWRLRRLVEVCAPASLAWLFRDRASLLRARWELSLLRGYFEQVRLDRDAV